MFIYSFGFDILFVFFYIFSLMLRLLFLCFALISFGCESKMEKPPVSKVIIKTTLGDIKVTLSPDKAPLSCANFLSYVDDKFYDHTIFHRVIKGFMIQGGGMTSDLKPKANKAPIKNEANNGLLNKRGTLALARTSVVDSATSQFFINDTDNDFLNFRNETPGGYGYCVFGKVTEGMDIVDKIAASKTTTKHGYDDVPVTTVEIISIRRE